MTTTMDLLSNHCFLELPASSCGEKRNDFSRKKGIQTLLYAVHTIDIHSTERLAKSQYLFAFYILEMIFKNSTK